jgi:thioester reductase-like protein
MRKYKNILLTGATGVVGQHILYELLRDFEQSKSNRKIFLIVRSTKNQSAMDRIESLLTSSFVPDFLKKYPLENLLCHIKTIETDLTSPQIKKILPFKKEDNVCVIHCAASTNLMTTDEAEKELKFSNFHATINLLNACLPFVSKFSFISTAFSCGIRNGFVDEDYLNHDQKKFRNPYERNKFLAEKELAKICTEKGIFYQILRPSIVCGRLIESPLFYSPKFDVFYGYTKFFYKLMDTPFSKTSLRIVASPERSVSNVIPVDYVAKAIVRAIECDDIVQMNIAHSKSIPLSFSLPIMIEINGFNSYMVVNQMPLNMNMLEAAYYSELGNISTPYLNDDGFEFDTRTLRKLLADIPEPNVLENTFSIFEFAKESKFTNYN